MLNRYIPIVIVLLLAGCANSPPPPETAQQVVYSLQASYNVALAGAVTYQRLPRCATNPTVTVCSKQSVVNLLREVDGKASTVLKSAQSMAISAASDEDKARAKNLAAEAVGMLKGVLAAVGITLPGA